MKNVTVIETELRNSLPALAELINKELGFTPILELEYMKWGGFVISSGELLDELGSTLVKTIFSSIKIKIWGELNIINNAIWFNPKLAYEHPNGGSNGTAFVWRHIGFNLDEKKWITGNKII